MMMAFVLLVVLLFVILAGRRESSVWLLTFLLLAVPVNDSQVADVGHWMTGRPPPMSTSTSIKWASNPSSPALKTFASMVVLWWLMNKTLSKQDYSDAHTGF